VDEERWRHGQDSIASSITIGVCARCFTTALRSTGTAPWLRALAEAIFLAAVAVGVLWLYRFLLFLIGIYIT